MLLRIIYKDNQKSRTLHTLESYNLFKNLNVLYYHKI